MFNSQPKRLKYGKLHSHASLTTRQPINFHIGFTLMTSEDSSKEQRILSIVKKTLTDVAKDTYTPPELRHPLSEQTINSIRECLSLISARESEIAEEAGKPFTSKPRFIDEPQDTVVVKLEPSGSKKKK